MKSLFIVDGSLDRPLLHSQGIPLLKQLQQQDVQSTILSFETADAINHAPLEQELNAACIRWVRVNSSGLRGDMLVKGFNTAWAVIRKEKINLVHCRSYRPGMIGFLLQKLTGVGFLFDMRGFLIDELVADGSWTNTSQKFFIAKQIERLMIQSADCIVATSPDFRDSIQSLPYFDQAQDDKVEVIPNCVDTQRFCFRNEMRVRIRGEMNWDGRQVLIFAGDGKRYLSTMPYMAGFFQRTKAVNPSSFLAVMSYGNHQGIREFLIKAGIREQDFAIFEAAPETVPDYLSAADVGLAFFKIHSFANAIASPIKFAEYLACGLPVVINPKVGDTGRILRENRAGVVVDPANEADVSAAIEQLSLLLEDPQLKNRCVLAAQRELSLSHAADQYLEIYRRIARH